MSQHHRGLVFTGIGFELVGLVIGAVTLGGVLDEKFDLKGIGTAGLIILCFIGWFCHLIVLLKGYMKHEHPKQEIKSVQKASDNTTLH